MSIELFLQRITNNPYEAILLAYFNNKYAKAGLDGIPQHLEISSISEESGIHITVVKEILENLKRKNYIWFDHISDNNFVFVTRIRNVFKDSYL